MLSEHAISAYNAMHAYPGAKHGACQPMAYDQAIASIAIAYHSPNGRHA